MSGTGTRHPEPQSPTCESAVIMDTHTAILCILLICTSSVGRAGNYNLIQPVMVFLEKLFFHSCDINTLPGEKEVVQIRGC